MYENSSGIGGLYETLAQETGVDWQWTGEWGDTVHNYYKGLAAVLTAANSLLPIWRPSSNEVCVYGKQGLGKREGEMDVWRDKISSSADCLCLLTVLFSTAGQFGRVGQLALYGCARPEVPHDGLYLTLYRLSLSLFLLNLYLYVHIYTRRPNKCSWNW